MFSRDGLCHDLGSLCSCRVACVNCGCIFRRLIEEVQKLGTGHLTQHGSGQWVGLAVVVDVHIHAVDHIEVRIAEEFFHGRVFDLGRDVTGHEVGVIRLGRELLHIAHGRCGYSSSRCVLRLRLMLRRLTQVSGRRGHRGNGGRRWQDRLFERTTFAHLGFAARPTA